MQEKLSFSLETKCARVIKYLSYSDNFTGRDSMLGIHGHAIWENPHQEAATALLV